MAWADRDGRIDAIAPGPGLDVPARRPDRALLNPGSVGQPRDGDPTASWLEIDTDAGVATWRRAAYDVEAVRSGDARRRPARAGSPIASASGSERCRVIGGRQPLQGRKPGDRRVRVERPHAAHVPLDRARPAHGQGGGIGPDDAGAAGCSPGSRRSSSAGPLASEEEIGERLSKKKALAIFSSDAISSSAYATEEILRVLILGGVAALAWGLWVSVAIAVLLIAVAISYRQICLAYPTGGGSYSVSKRNFGRQMSLIAASALMIDYVMTVAVSTASSIEQVTSAVPELIDERVILGVLAITLITIGNLRGLREAGNLFAIPTYLFLGSALLMIVDRLGPDRRLRRARRRSAAGLAEPGRREPPEPVGHPPPARVRRRRGRPDRDGGDRHRRARVPAARGEERGDDPGRRWPALLGVLFIGLTFLAVNFGITHIDLPEKQTVISQIAGDGSTARARSRSSCSRGSPRCCSSWPRTRASTRSRGCSRSSRSTATCPASSRSAATGSRSATGSSSWPRSPPR